MTPTHKIITGDRIIPCCIGEPYCHGTYLDVEGFSEGFFRLTDGVVVMGVKKYPTWRLKVIK